MNRPSLRTVERALLVVAAGAVVWLAHRVDVLRHEVMRVRVESRIPAVGSTLPEFHARAMSGDSVIVGRGGTQILFYFTTGCAFCRENLPAWASVAERAGALTSRVTVLGLANEPDSVLREYQAAHAIQFESVRFPDLLLAQVYKHDVVPLTVVVSATGEVLYRRLGVLSPVAIDSVIGAARASDSLSRLPATSTGG